jgi:hypothetical protein
MIVKVLSVTENHIEFDNGVNLLSSHDSDCCESHWLSFEHLSLFDFEGLEFDLTNDDFFKKIPGFGIELIPLHGHSVKIPGYGSNNGYYSTDLQLVLSDGKGFYKEYDITDCQDISD